VYDRGQVPTNAVGQLAVCTECDTPVEHIEYGNGWSEFSEQGLWCYECNEDRTRNHSWMSHDQIRKKQTKEAVPSGHAVEGR